MKPSEDLPEFIGDTVNLVNALRHITDTQSNNVTTRLVAKAAADLIEGLIPRPIKDAPKDGSHFLANIPLDKTGWKKAYYLSGALYIDGGHRPLDPSFMPTHFIPLSAIQKLMESGE